MKAFVIKNKEGKYLAVSSGNYERYWTTIDFAHYFRFLNKTHDAKQEAEEFRNTRYPDCEVVEITISEGDLEQENKQLKERIQNILDGKEIPAISAKKYEEYEQQLAEKDKETHKQVCDEIREKLKAHCDYTDEENIGWYLVEHKIDTLLDQIEQAKESIDE